MKKQLSILVSLIVAVSMILTGCAAPTAAPTAAAPAPTAEPIIIRETAAPAQVVVVTATPEPVTAPEGGEIAVIVKTGNSSFWQNVQTGAMAA